MLTADVVEKAAADPKFKAQLEADPVAVLSALPFQSDPLVYRVGIAALGSVVILALVGDLVLAFYGKPVPEGVIALGSGALGALAGLFVLPRQGGK